MLPLLNAIYASFIADSTLTTAFPGGMQRDKAPEGTAMPYVVSRVLAATTEHAFGGTARSRTQVRFSVFAVGHDAAALAETLAAALDTTLLTLSSGINDSVVRLGDPTPTLLNHDGMGNDVWEWSVVFEYGVVS